MYTRILLKISGEQLGGSKESGMDPEVINYLADEIKQLSKTKCQVVIVVGGGNIVRGAQMAGHGILRVTADHMGMLATLINALALTDIFESHGLKTRCLSSVIAEQVAEPFVFRLANKHLEKGRVIIVAGGTSRPFLTTDTAAVDLALELDCQVVLKATKVDGVYDKDPVKHPKAKRLATIPIRQAVHDKHIKVMDKAALGLAMEQNMPVVVFDIFKPSNLLKLVNGNKVGTLIS